MTSRRDLLILFAGTLLSAEDFQPKFFSSEDFDALRAFTEILIPTDDTPGAREAGCAQYIDFWLHAADGAAPALQKPWRDAMNTLRQAGFHAADPQGRAALVEAMSKPGHPEFSVFQLIKQQNTFAFYTARAGMIETLDYKGDSFNTTFPACEHPEHHVI